MYYRTKSGTHYHTALGCCGAVIPCDAKGLESCSRCANSGTRVDAIAGVGASDGYVRLASNDDLSSPAAAERRYKDFATFKKKFLQGVTSATSWEEYYDEQRRIAARSDDSTQNQLITSEILAKFVKRVNEDSSNWSVGFHDLPVSEQMREELDELIQNDRNRLMDICDQVYSVMRDPEIISRIDPMAQDIARRLRWRRGKPSGNTVGYSAGEEHILSLLGSAENPKTFVTKDGKHWRVRYSPPETAPAKPAHSKGSGSPKTDVFFTAESEDGEERTFRLSLKQSNAVFVENKIQPDRAERLFGKHLSTILEYLGEQLPNLVSNQDLTGTGSRGSNKGKVFRTLGFTFDLISKPHNGYTVATPMDEWDLPVDTKEMRKDIVKEAYSGAHTRDELRNAKVNGVVVPDSGIAEYMLIEDEDESFLDYGDIQDVIDRIVSIDDYVENGTQLYFKFHPINDYSESESQSAYSNRSYRLLAYVDWAIGSDGYEVPTIRIGNPFRKKASDVHSELIEQLAQ